MVNDMVVALGAATKDGNAFFGQNCQDMSGTALKLDRTCGHDHCPGEKVVTHFLELPQAKHTLTTLGLAALGSWGYRHGINENGVAIGCTLLRTKLRGDRPGLLADELVRLALERSGSARQAVDCLTDLIRRYGQSTLCDDNAETTSHAYLIADAREAFVVESGGPHWVYQEIRAARAVSPLCTIRQDWNRISAGLASLAFDYGWWMNDGGKVDFAEAFGDEKSTSATDESRPAVLGRWGRATILLEQQSGAVDATFLRRLLSDHADETDDTQPTSMCRHAPDSATVSSFIAQSSGDPLRLSLGWQAFGPPCMSVYFPVTAAGELPAAFGNGDLFAWSRKLNEQRLRGRQAALRATEAVEQLQATIDQETDAFVVEGNELHRLGRRQELARLAESFMQHNIERFEATLAELQIDILRRDDAVKSAVWRASQASPAMPAPRSGSVASYESIPCEAW